MFNIGIITKAQGIKGEIRVHPTTDDPHRFELLKGKEVFVIHNDKRTAYTLLNARVQKNVVIVKLKDVDDRNLAEKLIRSTIAIDETHAIPLDEHEYFVRDIMGLQVISDLGEPLGIIADVLHTGANDVYVIENDQAERFMIPAIKDVVIGVDMNKQQMTVKLIEGLRELTL